MRLENRRFYRPRAREASIGGNRVGNPAGTSVPELRFGIRVVVADVGPGVGLGDAQVSQQQRTARHGHGHPESVSIPALGESVVTEGRVSHDSLAETTSHRTGSWIEFDVAATPAAPPPATSQPGRDGAANSIVVSTSMMAAASTHRYIVVDLGSGYPARRIPAHLDPLLHVGSPYYLEGIHPLFTELARDAELGRGIGHLRPRETARRHEDAKVHPSTAGGPASRSAVKSSLTPNRRPSVENDEYASFIHRVQRAYSRRVAAGVMDALADMTGLAAELDEVISQAVAGLHEAGYSWTEIAARLRVTRQAAQQRWGRS